MPSESTPLSPCVSRCQIDEDSGFCSGCLRTIDEIVSWVQLSETEKRQVLLTIQARKNDLSESF